MLSETDLVSFHAHQSHFMYHILTKCQLSFHMTRNKHSKTGLVSSNAQQSPYMSLISYYLSIIHHIKLFLRNLLNGQ